jgi:hypothetical protein
VLVSLSGPVSGIVPEGRPATERSNGCEFYLRRANADSQSAWSAVDNSADILVLAKPSFADAPILVDRPIHFTPLSFAENIAAMVLFGPIIDLAARSQLKVEKS